MTNKNRTLPVRATPPTWYNQGMDPTEETIARIEASARLEGIELDEQTRELMRRRGRGEITIDEAIAELDRRFKRSAVTR